MNEHLVGFPSCHSGVDEKNLCGFAFEKMALRTTFCSQLIPPWNVYFSEDVGLCGGVLLSV